MILYVLIVALMVVLFICLGVYATNYKTVPPNQAMVVFGKKFHDGFMISQGGGKFIFPLIEQVEYLDLTVRTLEIRLNEVLTSTGVMINIEATAMAKISSEEDIIRNAAEQLLSKDHEEINYIAQRTLEGHLRGICAQLTVEEINGDRNKMAGMIMDTAIPDLNTTGLTVITFVITRLFDEVGYLEALGKKATAEVVGNASIAEAEAEREGDIGVAMAMKEAQEEEVGFLKRAEEVVSGQAGEASKLFILARALEKTDTIYQRESGDILRILEDKGMGKNELDLVKGLIRDPGVRGIKNKNLALEEVQKKLAVWKADLESRSRDSRGTALPEGGDGA